MNSTERHQLLDALIDGSITPADRLRIEAELIVDPAVRREYYQRLQLDLLLEQVDGNALGDCVDTDPTGNEHSADRRLLSPATRWSGWAVLAALAASLLLAAGYWWSDSAADLVVSKETKVNATPFDASEPSAVGFAVLNGQVDAAWDRISPSDGDLLPTGRLQLRRGRAHLELFSGVHVVLEGPADFQIDSPMQLTMHAGRARAKVPKPAQGFRIKTTAGDVVDLGTEFSLAVDAQGADVMVVDGEIELHQAGRETVRAEAGTALRLLESGTIDRPENLSLDLQGPDEFQRLHNERNQLRLERWQAAHQSLEEDPRIIAHYVPSETPTGTRELPNRFHSQDQLIAGPGTIIAAQPTLDRWGRSRAALDFSRPGSRVRVNIPGQHRGLTLLCWVKINSLDRWYNSLFLTDGHDDGEPHWQMMDDGRIFFSVKVPASSDQSATQHQHVFYSPSVWNPTLSGRWLMLAVTYDVDRQTVTHYLNGRKVSSEVIPPAALVESIRIGPASLCNWNEPKYRTDPKFVLRNLNGCMDEFLFVSGVLTDTEILHRYRVGNPNEH